MTSLIISFFWIIGICYAQRPPLDPTIPHHEPKSEPESQPEAFFHPSTSSFASSTVTFTPFPQSSSTTTVNHALILGLVLGLTLPIILVIIFFIVRKFKLEKNRRNSDDTKPIIMASKLEDDFQDNDDPWIPAEPVPVTDGNKEPIMKSFDWGERPQTGNALPIYEPSNTRDQDKSPETPVKSRSENIRHSFFKEDL